MKRLLVLSLLTIGAVGLTAAGADAWFKGCCRPRCCHRCCTTLCIKPYNAFSPVAYGNIVADGCMPVNIYGGQLPCGPSVFNGGYGGGCAGGSCFSSGCCEGACLPAPGAVAGVPQIMPGQPMPEGAAGPQFNPPMPQSVTPQAYWQQVQYMQYLQQLQMMQQYQAMQQMRVGYNGVQSAGYQQGYNPYVPMVPVSYNVPSYWYGR
jgi:hypothetical protein